MNGFKLQADAIRKVVESDDDCDKEVMLSKAKVYDILSELTQDQIYELYNSSAFNDVTKAYAKRAMETVGLDEEQISDVLREIKYLHDTVSAGEIVK